MLGAQRAVLFILALLQMCYAMPRPRLSERELEVMSLPYSNEFSGLQYFDEADIPRGPTEKRALMRLGKRAMMRLGKRAMMRLGK